MREQENFEQGLEYSTNRMKAALEELSSDFLKSDFLKGLIDSGTKLIEILDYMISRFGTLQTVLIGIGTVWGSKHLGIFNTQDSGSIFGAITQSRRAKADTAAYQNVLTLNEMSSDPDALLHMRFDTYKNVSEEVKNNLIDIQSQVRNGTITAAEGLGKINRLMEKTNSFSTKLGASFKNIGISLLNGLVSSAVLAGVSWLINKIDQLVVTLEEAEKLSDQFNDSFTSMTQQQANGAKAISGIEKEYDELSKGVNALGENVSLTKEEFERYHQITETIANYMPELIQGYDDQGNAIIRLRDNVDSLSEAYERNQQLAAQDLYNKKDDDGNRYAEGVFKAAEGHFAPEVLGNNIAIDVGRQVAELESLSKMSLGSILEKGLTDYQGEVLEDLGVDIENFSEITEEEFDDLHVQIEQKYNELLSTLEADTQRIGEYGLNYAKGYLGYYRKLSSEQQRIFDGIFNSMDYFDVAKNNLWDEGEMKKYTQEVMNVIEGLSSKDLEKIELGVDITTMWNNDELTYDEYITKITEFDKILHELFPENEEIIKAIKVVFDIPDANEIQDMEQASDTVVQRRTRIVKGVRDDERGYIDTQLGELEKGGNVNLKLRPEIDTKYLKDKGWKDIEDGIATVYTSTFSNEDETKFINFTPIIVDPETGEFKGVLSPEELQEYAEGVIAGTKTDDLNLQIGTEFDTVEEADSAAERIHKLHERKSQLPGQQLPEQSTKPNVMFGSQAWFEQNKPTQAPLRDQPGLTDEEIQKGEEAYDKFYHSLTIKEQEFVDSISDDELEITADYTSVEEFKKWWDKIRQDNSMEVEIETKSSKGVSDLKAMDDAFGDDLATAYNATKTQGGKATATEIEAVNTAFGGTTFDAGADQDVNLLSSAIENYNDALVENAGDANAAQTATNQLATAYVDQSGVLDTLIDDLDHVTDAEKDYYIQQLKDQGITNAKEVVESRLTKQYKKHAEALKNLSKYVTQNNTLFEQAVKDQNADADVIKKMTGQVSELLAVYDEDGNKIEALSPDIDPSFIIENADLIQQAIAGDIEAIGKLRVEASKKILFNAELYDDAFWSDANLLTQQIAELDSSDFEVGAYLNSAPFLATLASLQSQFSGTMAQFKAWISEITGGAITADYEWDTVRVGETTQGFNGAPSDARVNISAVDVKTLKGIKYKWNGTQTGATSKYGGGGGSSGSSGGGGGSGSDSSDNDTANEDSEETFDWIEVAIQRIEEDISRLDTVIEDVYSGWGKRNDKITEKIKKLTQEIEAQTTAYEEYMDYANNEIKINDGEAPNADDYENGTSDVQYTYDKGQYDEAVSQWATGEYQKKVREGLMTGEDIEKIQNQYLVEAINAYKEYYEKAIAAQDKVKELEITKKDQYKQLFENLIEEYEDDVTNIEKKADIINERISRTEELGFFVDKSYYDKLIEYEKQKNQQYATELQKVVNQFNTAVNEGKIQKGTAAWDEMYQQVMDVNKGYEESNTELVKLNNTIRQLEWDKFDWLEERLDDISAEAEWLIGLLQGEENYTDKGFLNNRGFAQAALVGAKYNSTLEKQQRYKEQIADIDKKLATNEGKNDKNLIARKEELLKVYRDSISAAEEEKKAMQSLVRDGISKHIEALTELIDKYKESMSSAKDLYEYQKNLTNQTKTIADLEKQLAAYQGDDSEETRKKRQELQKQLNDAQQQLEETEWDRYISETNQMLDDMKTDYEKYLNDQTESITKVMMDMIPYINDNKTAIQNGLNEIKTEYGITTQNFENFANTQDGILSVFRNGDFASKLTGIHDVIKDFKTEMAKVTDTTNNGILGIVEKQSKDVSDIAATLGVVDSTNNPNKPKDNGTKGSKGSGEKLEDSLYSVNDGTWKKDTKGWWFEYPDGYYEQNKWQKINDKWYYFDENGYMAQDEYRDGYWLAPDGAMSQEYTGGHWMGSDENGWWYEDNGWYPKNGWYRIDGDWYYFDENGWMATSQYIGDYWVDSNGKYKAYAKGSKHISNDQLAWTQENASELIYRTSDGAILTPLNRGDMVFTNDMSQRLWEIAKGNLPTSVSLAVPNVNSNTARNVTANNNITIELPNVENYDDFKREMKQDKDLEKFWQEITIGQVMGNNTLKKNKY